MIDARAEGGAYTRVFLNGQEWSKHTAPHKAAETAYDLALEALRQGVTPFPKIWTFVDGRVYYEPDPNVEAATIPPAPQPVISDGGEDLIDFLERIGPTPRVEVEITAPTLMQGLEVFLDSTRAGWLIEKMYHRAADGTKTLVAYGWRGFGLVVHRRVKGTIKLGGTT